MHAVILVGGKGTRLKPFTMTIPKPLLPLGDVPILEVVIRQLAAAGVTRVVLTLGHMAHLFTASIGEGRRWGVDIEFCREDEPLGTAAPLRLIQRLDDVFLVMNGDILTSLDFGALVAHHRQIGAWGTIAVSQRKVHIDYGVVRSTPDGLLDGYDEKPTIEYGVSMGINVLSRDALRFLPPTGRFDMPDLMKAIAGAGHPVACYRTSAYWQDIGRMDDYAAASQDFTDNPGRFLPATPP
jgi:NDP-sugar pyrophosphorylase family protein